MITIQAVVLTGADIDLGSDHRDMQLFLQRLEQKLGGRGDDHIIIPMGLSIEFFDPADLLSPELLHILFAVDHLQKPIHPFLEFGLGPDMKGIVAQGRKPERGYIQQGFRMMPKAPKEEMARGIAMIDGLVKIIYIHNCYPCKKSVEITTAPREPRNDDLYSEIATGQKPFAMTIVMKRLYYSAVLRKTQPYQQENSYIVNVYDGKI